jgi:hypothetical protein
MKRLFRKSSQDLEDLEWIDEDSRSRAFIYVDGKFYVGPTHSTCMSNHLESIGEEELKDKRYRLHDRELRDFQDTTETFFAGHIIDGTSQIEKIKNVIRDENAIYLMPMEWWFKNVTPEEAAKIITESAEFSEYKVYLDDIYTMDEEGFRVYPKLARLKKTAR